MRWRFSLAGSAVALAACLAASAQTPTYNVGRTPSAEELRAWDTSIGPAGNELPAGRGSAREGAPIYAQKCAPCHGPNGEGSKTGIPLVGGQGTLTTPHPVKTIGSFWPFATAVWDFINRGMPPKQEGTLQPDEVYALTAFLLYKNGILQENDVLDAPSLPKVQMPNRNGFIPPRWEDLRRGWCRRGPCP